MRPRERLGRRAIDALDDRELFGRLPDHEARAALVRRYLPLADYLARRFSGRGEPPEDLLQVASVGLLNAVDRFDAGREVQFSTYAAVTILGELKRHFRDKGWSVRVPRRLQELGLRINSVQPTLYQQLRRSPTVEEIAEAVGASVDEVLEAMDASQAYSTVSIDTPVSEEGTAPVDTLGGEDPSMVVLEEWATIAPAVRRLPQRERTVLYLRFFRGKTQSEIARHIGVSQMHVSRILAQTLRTLREAAGSEADADVLEVPDLDDDRRS